MEFDCERCKEKFQVLESEYKIQRRIIIGSTDTYDTHFYARMFMADCPKCGRECFVPKDRIPFMCWGVADTCPY